MSAEQLLQCGNIFENELLLSRGCFLRGGAYLLEIISAAPKGSSVMAIPFLS